MSKLFVIGLSHRTAPLTLRESLAVPEVELRERLQQAASVCGEALLLSTCNRVELYGALSDEAALGELRRVLLQSQPEAAHYLYEKQGDEAVGHLFRVASSLDSLVVGEPQILGQLKQAFRSAQEVGTVGVVLGASSIWPSRAISTSPRRAPWCSTRPTKCSTSASSPMSRPSWR